MGIGVPVGIDAMLKDGAQHITGTEEAVIRNIEACKQLADIVRTSFGPNGMNKMVINHLQKLAVTSDAATIVKELEVVHPAAKMIVLASKHQEAEMGDATNLVVMFAGELLKGTASLLRQGLHVSDIVDGFCKGIEECLKQLDQLSCFQLDETSFHDETKLTYAVKTIVGAKQYGWQDLIAETIAKAAVMVMPKDASRFNVDNIRVAKILGGGMTDVQVVKGFVLTRDSEGTIKKISGAKVVVFGCETDIHATETKATVLINNAKELENFHKGEEDQMEALIKSIKEAGANVIVSNNKIGELTMHYIEREGLMAVKCPSKFELRRICRAVGATALPKFEKPNKEDIGYCDLVEVEEIGSSKCVVFKQFQEESQVATIIVRAATQNFLDDVERCVDDGVNGIKAMTRDQRFVAGGGAAEIELARRINQFAASSPGMDQYALKKFAEALEVVPRALASTSGADPTDLIASLYAAHEAGNPNIGVDIENHTVLDMCQAGILDHLLTKYWAFKLAADAAITVLRIDQIIMAKPAGGPKPREAGPMDHDD
eukprot:TRINITY_DN2429_c0_g1::TRINITY_DN2429_c0_g1_i1::g.8961::m.8961 TRINITY_DN2429_c0_g1::TRINITY_DN2429_c0_g1_i1::g.8961  ORF type:complete len:545 (+),score=205.65,sp/Q552J0/TCPQ_DICDI/50.93/0.0,Cpn60_TCP1/PF00118.19/1.7e-138 TRINITY_DN2429_c0_g1_i1:78-1712(+)